MIIDFTEKYKKLLEGLENVPRRTLKVPASENRQHQMALQKSIA